jgi:hypothetical protein
MMVIAIPITGTTIRMGGVHHAYFGSYPTTGANVTLRGTLGSQIGIVSGSISLSSAFGARSGPFDYI